MRKSLSMDQSGETSWRHGEDEPDEATEERDDVMEDPVGNQSEADTNQEVVCYVLIVRVFVFCYGCVCVECVLRDLESVCAATCVNSTTVTFNTFQICLLWLLHSMYI